MITRISCPICHEDQAVDPGDDKTSLQTIAEHAIRTYANATTKGDIRMKIVTVELRCSGSKAKIIEAP
jgi:hypothetical protein